MGVCERISVLGSVKIDSSSSSNNNNITAIEAVKQSAPVQPWNRRTSGNSDQIVVVVVVVVLWYSFTGVRVLSTELYTVV